MTLTSDLVFRIFVSGAYHITCGRNPKFGVCMHIGMRKFSYHPWVTVALTSDLV